MYHLVPLLQLCLIPLSPPFSPSTDSFPFTYIHTFPLLTQVAGSDGRRVTVVGVEVSATDLYRCELVAEGPPFHTTQRSANMTVGGEYSGNDKEARVI